MINNAILNTGVFNVNFKRIISLIISAVMVFSLTACKDDESVAELPETTSVTVDDYTAEDITETEPVTYANEEPSVNVTDTSLATETVTVTAKNPDEFTKAEIIEMYKNAATKSHSSAISKHSVEITKIIINGEELGSGFDFVKKIVNSFISNNTEDSKGITGGYKNLVENDAVSAKAYAVGDNTAIEMVMKNQTDGAKSDIHAGSVGHVIDVVGDISVVTNELTELGLPIEIPSESTSIHYTNAVVKVLIDSNGNIIKGTWSYTVEIRLKDYKVFGADVESSSIIMNNVITVE